MSTDVAVRADSTVSRVLRWVLGALGVAGIGWGVLLTFGAAPTWPERISTGLWLLVPPVLDDVILLPVAALIGWLVVRRLRRPWRDVVLVALTLSLVAVILAVPFLSGYGRLPDNPSLLDRHYVGGTLVVLGVIWVGSLLAGSLLARRRPARSEQAGASRRAGPSRRAGAGPE